MFYYKYLLNRNVRDKSVRGVRAGLPHLRARRQPGPAAPPARAPALRYRYGDLYKYSDYLFTKVILLNYILYILGHYVCKELITDYGATN